MRRIEYNSQRDNKAVSGLSPNVQCFATSAWMFLSYFAPDKYPAADDRLLSYYVSDVTAAGTEKEFEWQAQADMIQKYLDAAGVKKRVKLGIDLDTGEGLISIPSLSMLLDRGPVIIGTKKMGTLPGGHIILGCDISDGKNVICNDPYGNANSNYMDTNGNSVIYSVDMFDKKSPNMVRGIYAE